MRHFLTLIATGLLMAVVGVSSASAGLMDFGPVPLGTIDASAVGAAGAETRPASDVGEHTARLNGKVNPHDRPTTYHFEFGPTTAYGSRTTDTAAGKGQSGVSAVATISGLTPGTTYHFRLVAQNDAGTTYGADMTFATTGDPGAGSADPGSTPSGPSTTPGGPSTTPGEPGATPGGEPAIPGGDPVTPQPGAPTPGPDAQPDLGDPIVIGGQPEKTERFAIAPTAGRISVDPPGPGGFQPLEEGVSVPIGSIVDAREGTAAITTEVGAGRTQTGEFWGERFKVRQPAGERGLTEIRVRDAVRACDGKSISAKDKPIGSARKRRGRLWGRDSKGRWRTHGRGSQATTRGTTWFSEERCDGTYTKVLEGSVLVRDHFMKRNVVVDAGESYLAHPRRKHARHVR